MKKVWVVMLSLLFALCLSSVAFAADAEIAKTDTKPEIDGKSDEVWNNAGAYDISNSLEVKEGVPIESDADLSGTWKALWDDTHFYILYEIKDDDRIRDSWDEEADEGQNHWDDSVELYLATSGVDAEYSNFRWVIGEPGVIDAYSGPKEWADIDPAPIEFKIHDSGDEYVLEAAIPWEAFYDYQSISSGQTIYLDIHVNDDDADPQLTENKRDGKIAWYGTEDNAWTGTEFFGTATLTGGSVAIGENQPQSMPDTGFGGSDSQKKGAAAAWLLVGITCALIAVRKKRPQR